MEELNKYQQWCKDLIPVIQACVEGKDVELQDSNGEWVKKHKTCGFEFGYKYRIKPRTITVNGFEVPEPMRGNPKKGSTYYVPSPSDCCMFFTVEWCNDDDDNYWLSIGLCHATQESAIAHAKAMLGIDPNGSEE